MITTLYKAKDDKFLEWSVEVKGDCYRIHHGQVGGKITTSTWKKASPKNIGKSNETNPDEQAQLEAEALIRSKMDEGYSEAKGTTTNSNRIEPMLAKKFSDYANKIDYPVYTQPKFDGIRCIITREGMFSRNNKEITACPFIFEEAKKILDKYQDIIALDGELYSHDLNKDFNQIVSMVKKVKPSDKDIEEAKKLIKFHCYDYVGNGNFSDRNDLLFNELTINKKYTYFNNKYIRPVVTSVIYNEEELNEKHSEYIMNGYEGTIVRLDAEYEQKRSKNLLKKKDFLDDEFPILDIIEGEGNRSGMAGFVSTKTKQGKPFKANIKGGFDYYKELLTNKSKYIGKLATIRYFTPTPDGIPRFPVVVDIDRKF